MDFIVLRGVKALDVKRAILGQLAEKNAEGVHGCGAL